MINFSLCYKIHNTWTHYELCSLSLQNTSVIIKWNWDPTVLLKTNSSFRKSKWLPPSSHTCISQQLTLLHIQCDPHTYIHLGTTHSQQTWLDANPLPHPELWSRLQLFSPSPLSHPHFFFQFLTSHQRGSGARSSATPNLEHGKTETVAGYSPYMCGSRILGYLSAVQGQKEKQEAWDPWPQRA